MTSSMNNNEEYGALVVFTTLAPLSVGGLIGLLVVRSSGLLPGIDWAAMVVLATGILALFVSLLHLGRPWRAPLALMRLGTSWLSREVILFGAFLLMLGCYAILPALSFSGTMRTLFGYACAIIGFSKHPATVKPIACTPALPGTSG
jgi:anaerobic dimethyl sulfoxide reductase subunit C (anchor subunit)